MSPDIEINDCDVDEKPDSESKNSSSKTADENVSNNSEHPAPPQVQNEKMSKIKESLEKLKSQVNQLQHKNTEYLDHLQRMKAEFDNYKKRIIKEKADSIRYANDNMSQKLLPVIDNLQRGLKHASENSSDESIIEGFNMVEKQLLDVLAEFGVNPFDSLDRTFDPELHEPLYMIERDDVEDGIVIEEIEKGYLIHDRLLRAAKVAVSRKP